MKKVCMICGKTDCREHDEFYAYPLDFCKAVFGEKDDFSEDISALSPFPVPGIETREYCGVNFAVSDMGFYARYQGKEYSVSFADIRLYGRGVKFFYCTCTQDTIELLSNQQPKPETDSQTTSKTVLCEQNPTRESPFLPDEVFKYVSEKYEDQSIIAELVSTLKAIDKNKAEVISIEKNYNQQHLSYETTVLLLLSFFPNASNARAEYQIPIMSYQTEIVYFREKNKNELFLYLRQAIENLYPTSILRRQVTELVKYRYIHTLVKNIFHIGVGDPAMEDINRMLKEMRED